MKSRDQERNDFRDFAKLLSKYTIRAKIRGTEKLIAEGKGMWVKKKNGGFEWCGEIISTRFHSDKVIIEFRNTLETTEEPRYCQTILNADEMFITDPQWVEYMTDWHPDKLEGLLETWGYHCKSPSRKIMV